MNDNKIYNTDNSVHLPVGTTLQQGKYRIDAFLASGGFGNTYRATRTDFNEKVAIKEFFMKEVSMRDVETRAVSVSTPEGKARFQEQKNKFVKEARRIRNLSNPHIIGVIDLFEEKNTAYYVMDFILGGTLAERVKAYGVISEEKARKYMQHILNALDTVHAGGFYHLDIKPSNILIDEKNDRAILIDFGASKMIDSEKGIEESSILCYTPGYAPSEQEGMLRQRIGPWTDLYALGATFYYAMTARRPPKPFEINEDGERVFSFPATMSDDMKQLILWMMMQRSIDRPQNVREMMERLNRQHGAPIADPKMPPPLTLTDETVLADEQPPPLTFDTHITEYDEEDDENKHPHFRIIVIVTIVASLILAMILTNVISQKMIDHSPYYYDYSYDDDYDEYDDTYDIDTVVVEEDIWDSTADY